MIQAFVTQKDEIRDVNVAVTVQPSELGIAPQYVLTQALAYCARKMSLDGPQPVVERLRQGDSVACGYCLYSIAKQVAETIASLDENVKAVYALDYDATPEDLCFGKAMRGAPMVHLIVWTGRKTAALRSLVLALDRTLAQAYATMLGMRPSVEGTLASLLDVQVIDDADVASRTGYGALLRSIHHRPIQIWER
jgi:hypothetical protein